MRSVGSLIVFRQRYVESASLERLTIAATHEIGHAVILNNPHEGAGGYNGNRDDGMWTGNDALASYREFQPYAQSVPMSGRAHWSRDFVLPNRDIMQPRWFGNSKLGPITVGAMRDYGYKINEAAVESYSSVGAYTGAPLFQCVESSDGVFSVKMLAK